METTFFIARGHKKHAIDKETYASFFVLLSDPTKSGVGATPKNQEDPTLAQFKQNKIADLGLCYFNEINLCKKVLEGNKEKASHLPLSTVHTRKKSI